MKKCTPWLFEISYFNLFLFKNVIKSLIDLNIIAKAKIDMSSTSTIPTKG